MQRAPHRRYTEGRSAWVVAVALAAEHLVTGTSDGFLRVWPTRHSGVLFERELGGWIRAVAASEDRVACGGADGRVVFADLDGSGVVEGQGASGTIHAIAIAPHGSDLVVAAMDNLVIGWSLSTGEDRFRASCHAPVRAVAFAADGQALAAGGADGSVNILRASDGMITSKLRAPFAPRTIAFEMPSGDVVAAGADGRTIAWARGVARERRAGEGPIAPVWNVALSPGAARVATGGVDGVARVHDHAGAGVVEFEHGAVIRSLAFSSDGSSLVTGGADGRARLWSVAPAHMGAAR